MGTGCDIWGSKRMELAITLRDLVLPKDLDWFIENGSLLGAFRSGKFIPHDDDFDTGAIIVDMDNIENIYRCIQDKLPLPYKARRISSYADKIEVYDPSYGSYMLEGYDGADFHYVTVDVQFHLLGDSGICKALYRRGNQYEFKLEDSLPTSEISLEGESFPCPKNPEKLLLTRYGSIREGAVYNPDLKKYVDM